MIELGGKTAVITGASSGIGFALAEHCLREGMNVVLVGRSPEMLNRAEQQLASGGTRGRILGVPADVGDAEAVERLAERAYAEFSSVELLFNNAGLGTVSDFNPLWAVPLEDWQQIMGANVWGVVHGCREFVPRMLASGKPGHVVNVASIAGLITGNEVGIYRMTKHAVVSLSETLAVQLAALEAKVGVSVVCPGLVRTEIVDRAIRAGGSMSREQQERVENLGAAVAGGIDPAEVAVATFAAIREQRLYVLTHPEGRERVVARFEQILGAFGPGA
jgi:NAD(P)-dependent dehydrogenase (short-subunit alcohol dehydrogenase family)